MDQLKKVMKSKGYTAVSLAKALAEKNEPISRGAIGNILNERNSPRLSTLESIARLLKVEVVELLDEEYKIKVEKLERELEETKQALRGIQKVINGVKL